MADNTNTIKQIVRDNARQYGMIIALIVIILFFYILTGGVLLSPLNVTNIVLQNSYILILTVGMLPLILLGKFDLSVGSVAAFVGAVAAILTVKFHMPFVPVLLIGLGLGALIGVWQGIWIAYVGVPAFVATLSSMLLFRGLTIAVLDGRSIGPFSDSFKALSSSYLPDFFGFGPLHLTTIMIGLLACVFIFIKIFQTRAENKKYGFDVLPLAFDVIKAVLISAGVMIFISFFALYKGLPTVMILVAALIIIYTYITNNTVLGRRIYAQGGNERAALLSGIRTKLLNMFAFINVGVLSALAGMVFAARLNAGTPKAGNGFELDAIASCFIGGASASGGEGTVIGAIIGALIMGIMNNGMSIMGISIDLQQSIKGLILLLAVAFDVYTKSRK
ncbi:MAG: sugar ABC transporter permease [Treponema sp.]|jgi:putative multiple sugar transport system permease protein|nr:sugar ABC transporter permease [Treponema sp.]